MAITPPALIAGAARMPLLYGLFSAFTFRPATADRWESGTTFQADSCDPALGIGQWSCDRQVITLGGTGLTSFTLTLGAQTTASIDDAATAFEVQTALENLSNVDAGQVHVSGLPGHYEVTFDYGGGTLSATPTGGTGTAEVAPAGTGAYGLPKVLTGAPEDGVASPFTVYGHFSCSPVGWTPAEAQDFAGRHLLAREEARVERALWTGDLGNVPALQGAGTTDVSVAAAKLEESVGLLENYLATNYGSQGVIHMTRQAALVGLGLSVLTTSGGRLLTALGTPVVAGAGYPGTGPVGQVAAASTSWVYATPALFGYRSEVFTSSNRPGDLLDRATNDLYAVAERSYLLGFDPCGVAAALANLTPA